MLRADQVAEPADCHGAAPEVSELPCAVQAGGVPVNVVVDMPISRMGADDEGILSIPFRKRYLFHLPVVLSVIIRNRKLKSYTSWLDNKMEINIPTINPDDKIMGIDILGLDPMGYIIQTITTAEQNTRKNISKPTVTDYEFISSLLNNLNITNTNSNCTDSFNSCLNALLSCYDYLDSQNVASKGNSYFKRSFVKDCMQITKCCNIINNILIKDTVSSDALLWQLINLLKDSSRLVKSSPDDAIYAIVDNKSDEYKSSSKEIRHDCPRALLWAALFVNNKSGNETYLSQHL